ncbi:hypothetical protein EV189_1663 [Motilibacter rhizosphaerae]|uniref:Uncharacterized protein n=1 Tax=Motilibacter rhizosphaerae TaxID=598652 RepID=A0A4Q7NS09_9ACTN|nr:hypothetical protein [Motilibacter rhizosphaerae]RZS89886.1 hypothetical protein EV189_1663 [Motilibacter rhizosphaerae]
MFDSFFKTVGDIADDAVDGVGNGIGVAWDLAKATHAPQAVGTGLDAAGKVYTATGRALSTAEQVTGGLAMLRPISPQQAWDNNISPVEAGLGYWSQVANDFGLHNGINYDTVKSYTRRGGANYSPVAMLGTGATDAVVSWYADPLVLAGKALKGVRDARTTVTAGDLKSLRPEAEGMDLTRRQQRVQGQAKAIIEGTDGLSSAELYQHRAFREAPQGAAMADLFAKANTITDETGRWETKRRILRVALGDTQELTSLSQERADLAAQIERLREPVEQMDSLGARTAQEDGQLSLFEPNDDQHLASAVAEWQASNRQLDALNRLHDTFGSWDTMPGLSPLDRARLERYTGGYVAQDGVLSTPLRVMAKATERRAAGWVNLHDEASAKQVQNMLQSVPRLSPEDRDALLGRYLAAPDDASRGRALDSIEAHVFSHVASVFDMDQATAEGVLRETRYRRGQLLQQTRSRAYTGATRQPSTEEVARGAAPGQPVPVGAVQGDDGAWTTLPIHETQLANSVPLLDVDALSTALKRARDQGLRSLANSAGDITRDGLDVLQSFWKATTLMRLGYPARVVTDSQLRIMSAVGAMTYLATAGEAGRNLLRNRTKATVADLVDASERATARIRLDHIDSLPAGQVDDALEAERSGLLDRLAEPAKTAKVDRGPQAKQRLGVGTRTVKGVQVEDAHGQTFEDYKLSMKVLSSGEDFSRLLANSEGQILNRLRGSGSFTVLRGTDEGHEAAWLRAVNQQLRQSQVASRLLAGQRDSEVVGWLKGTPEGRETVRRMRALYATPREWVANVRQDVEHLLPDESLRQTAAQRDMTVEDLRQAFPQAENRPWVHGELVAHHVGTGTVADFWNTIVQRWFRWANDLPEDMLGRHPLYVAAYRRKIGDLVARAQEDADGTLSADVIHALERQARQHAHKQVTSTLFDMASRTNAAHFFRFVSPFFSAWEDAMTKWTSIIARDPSVAVHGMQLWDGVNKGLTVVDANGQPVKDPKGLGEGQYIVLPALPGMGKLAGINNWRISKSSLNLVMQGDPWWLPGFGPLAQIPANEIVKRKPDLAKDLSWVLPYGPQASSLELATGSRTLVALRKAFNPSDADYASTFAQLYQAETIRYHQGQRQTAPTMDEIERKARNWYIARAVASGALPVSALPASKYSFYFDEAKRYRALYGADWQTKFYEAYPSYFEASISLNKNNTGIDATDRAWAASRKYKDLIAKAPEYGWFVVGEDADGGNFSPAVYTAQQVTRVAPGSSETYRSRKDPKDAIADVNTQRGWMQYQQGMDMLNGARTKLGLPSFSASGAEQLNAAKQAFVASLEQQNPDWQRDYTTRDTGRVARFLDFANAVANDPRMKGRGDMQAVRTYLQGRALMQQVLSRVAANGGSASLTATSNRALAQAWDAFATSLQDRYVTFSDVWSRVLEADDLTHQLPA